VNCLVWVYYLICTKPSLIYIKQLDSSGLLLDQPLEQLESDQLISRNDITGLILAGGRGRRVSGQDKGLLKYKGTSLIKRQIAWLKPQVKTVLISANRNIDQYNQFGYLVMQDQDEQFNGPLNGVLKALHNCSTPMLFVQPIDLPNLPDDLIDNLIEKLMSTISKSQNILSCDCYYLKSDQREHYLSMLIHRNCLQRLQNFVDKGERRVRDFHQSIGSVAVDLELDEKMFKNLNLEVDYQ